MGNILFTFMLSQSKDGATRLSGSKRSSNFGRRSFIASIPTLYSSLSPKQSYLDAQKHKPRCDGDFRNIPLKASNVV